MAVRARDALPPRPAPSPRARARGAVDDSPPKQIERLLAGTFAAVRFHDIRAEIVEVTVAGDMAYEVGKTVMTYEAGGQTYREATKYMVAWKRQPGGEWKIHRGVSNSGGFLL